MGVGGGGLDASLSRGRRGPMPDGDVICGGARARIESQDLRLGAGSEPEELDGAPSHFTPG